MSTPPPLAIFTAWATVMWASRNQDGIGQKLFEFSSHEEHVMTIRFLNDAPFKGSHGVYFAIKLAVLVLAVLLALHFFFGVM